MRGATRGALLAALLVLPAAPSLTTEDWVAPLPGGLEEATATAARAGFHLVAEVLPGSGIYQLSRQDRARRAAGAGLAGAFKLKPLSRVKRMEAERGPNNNRAGRADRADRAAQPSRERTGRGDRDAAGERQAR